MLSPSLKMIPFLLILSLCGQLSTVTVTADDVAATGVMKSTKSSILNKEADHLLREAMAMAVQLLDDHGEFYPFGLALELTGIVKRMGLQIDTQYPSTTDLMAQIQTRFRDGVLMDGLLSTALVYEVSMDLPDSAVPVDAITVELDHAEDLSLVIAYPYLWSEEGDLYFKDPIVMEGSHDIFFGAVMPPVTKEAVSLRSFDPVVELDTLDSDL
jgi:hypothetical protein